MASLRGNSLVWVAGVAAILSAATWYVGASGLKGARCKSTPCTYIDAAGRGRAGTCGAKKGDNAKCYCIANDDKALGQEQSGCCAKP